MIMVHHVHNLSDCVFDLSMLWSFVCFTYCIFSTDTIFCFLPYYHLTYLFLT